MKRWKYIRPPISTYRRFRGRMWKHWQRDDRETAFDGKSKRYYAVGDSDAVREGLEE